MWGGCRGVQDAGEGQLGGPGGAAGGGRADGRGRPALPPHRHAPLPRPAEGPLLSPPRTRHRCHIRHVQSNHGPPAHRDTCSASHCGSRLQGTMRRRPTAAAKEPGSAHCRPDDGTRPAFGLFVPQTQPAWPGICPLVAPWLQADADPDFAQVIPMAPSGELGEAFNIRLVSDTCPVEQLPAASRFRMRAVQSDFMPCSLSGAAIAVLDGCNVQPTNMAC